MENGVIDIDESALEKEATSWALQHNYSITISIEAWFAAIKYLNSKELEQLNFENLPEGFL